MRRLLLPLVIPLVVAALAPAARAQSQNKAAAEAAFQKARQLKDAGQVEEACTEFRRSQDLDPQLGTQYNLALCFEELGRLASAWAEYKELAALDTNKKRKADSARRAKALMPRLTHMMITVADPADGEVIERDGDDVTALVGLDTPVDPGTYVFTATAPGRQAWSASIPLTGEGAVVEIAVPPLAVEEVVAPPPHGGGVGDGDGDGDGAGPGDGERLPPPPPPSAPSGKRKLYGLVTAGAGVVVTGVGVVFGLQARGLRQDAEDACDGELDPCTGDVVQAGYDIEDARSKATMSTIFVGAGLAVVTAGVVLYLTAPSGRAERATALVPTLDRDGAGLAVTGRF